MVEDKETVERFMSEIIAKGISGGMNEVQRTVDNFLSCLTRDMILKGRSSSTPWPMRVANYIDFYKREMGQFLLDDLEIFSSLDKLLAISVNSPDLYEAMDKIPGVVIQPHTHPEKQDETAYRHWGYVTATLIDVIGNETGLNTEYSPPFSWTRSLGFKTGFENV